MQLDIIQRADQITLPENAETMQVLKGGPVDTGRGFVLHWSDFFIQDATLNIDDGICLTATVDILKAIAKGTGPKHAILALGYAGWAPGQLKNEIQHNGWLHCDADADLIFGDDVDERSCARCARSASIPACCRTRPGTREVKFVGWANAYAVPTVYQRYVSWMVGTRKPACDDYGYGNLLRRLLLHRWLGAGHRRAAHVAGLRLVVAAHAVHGLAVVPHHEVMQRPLMDMNELGLRGVLGQIAQQQPHLGDAHASITPACDDRYSDLRRCTGWVRTSRCSTGLNIAFSSSE